MLIKYWKELNMDYKKIYESQYGEKKLKIQKQLQFLGLRKILKCWDINRYDMCYKVAEKGEKVLDIGCGDGSMLFRLIDKYEVV